jgi:hypothetical protein
MVHLDHHLLLDARCLMDGANVHHLKEMIFAYEQAVDLHNREWPGHEIYRMQSEARLRLYVRRRQDEDIRLKTIAAMERGRQAAIKSIALADSYDRLEDRLEEWTDGQSQKIA